LVPIAKKDDLTEEQKRCLQMVTDKFAAADKLHSQLRPRWNNFYGLSRNWRRLAVAHSQATAPNDKDVVQKEIRRQFGQELFVPYCFTVIETNVPRVLSRTPRYRGLPGDPKVQPEHCRAMERLYERDSAAMKFERKLQETARSGFRYGLGVQKDYWEKKTRDGKKIAKKFFGGQKVVDDQVVVFEGPQVESVDIYDFFWDPAARDLETASYVIHRTWRSTQYIKDRVSEGRKNRAEGRDQGWADLDLDAISRMGSATKRGEAWDGRLQAAGLSGYNTEGNDLHEVWEYHDRDQVITVLDRELLVQEDINPFLHGDFPFQIYRPTIVEQEFCGIGEVEPIAHLQWELNTLRGQRRDAATLALNRGYFYQVGTLDPSKIVTGAGVFNPVFANPNEVIQPMPFVDIPQSGESEEQAIKGDIELTSAMSEAVVGAGGEETATGTQLVQAAANLRIKQKAKNLHVDLLVPEAAMRKALYEQFYVTGEAGQTVRIEDDTTPTGFAFIEVLPEAMAANIEMVPVDGSTEADDPAQKKHDASELAAALAPFAEQVNVPALIKYILGEHDIENAGDWLKEEPAGPDVGQIVQQIGQAMREAGIPEDEVARILESALQAQQTAQPEEEAAGPETTAPAAAPQPAGG
jgi:hypothetical protein